MSYPPPPGGSYPAQPGYGGMREHPRGTMILIFGILGLVCCMPFGIAAWVMGNTALREIDAAPGVYSNRGTVNAGRICGMVSVALTVLGIAFYAVVFIAIGVSES